MYYLKHEQGCECKTTHLMSALGRNFKNQCCLIAKKIKAKVYVNEHDFYHIYKTTVVIFFVFSS